MKYQAVLFDMDGTTVDSIEDMWLSVNATMEHFNMPRRSLQEVKAFVGNGAKVLIDLAVPAGTDEATASEVLAYYKAYYNDHCCVKTVPYKGIPEMIDTLRSAGIKVAIVSNKPDPTVHELCGIFFNGRLDYSAGESSDIRRKPAPDMVLKTVRELGVEKSRCVYVGDSEVDIATAKNADMECISVTWGFRTRQTLIDAGAVKLIDTVDELTAQLLQ